MSVKYRELDFRNEEEREKGIRYVTENAEVTLPKTRVVRIGKVPIRVSMHILRGQYYLVHAPRRTEYFLPRIWLVAIPGFALCQVPVGREMTPCHKRVTGVFVDNSELIYVCDYHGSGFKVLRGVLDRQLKPVPAPLCVRYCPQAIRVGVRTVVVRKWKKAVEAEEYLKGMKKKDLKELEKLKGEEEKPKEEFVELLEEVPAYECRAFMPYTNEKEETKRRRPYRGMLMLCVEDYWWRRYLKRREEVE